MTRTVYRCPDCGDDFPAGGYAEVTAFARHRVDEHNAGDVRPGDCARLAGGER